MSSGTFDLTGNQSIVLTGTHEQTTVHVSGILNTVEIDNTWSHNQGNLDGQSNVVSINNPDIAGQRIYGDDANWIIGGSINTMSLSGDFRDVGLVVGGAWNGVTFNGDFRSDNLTINGTGDQVILDHLRTAGLAGALLFKGSLISLSGAGNVLSLERGSSAVVTLENTITQADTIDIVGNQFGKSNSVVDVFGLTPTNGIIDLQGMGFPDPTTVYNDLISNPTTLTNGTAGFSLHLPGRPGELFIAGSSFTADNFKTS